MSKKSKMKKIAAKAAKSTPENEKQTSALGVKKSEKKKVEKKALIKALTEKSISVVNPPSNPVSDTSGKKKRKRRNKKKNKTVPGLQASGAHAENIMIQPSSITKSEVPTQNAAVDQLQKSTTPASHTESINKSKKKRSKKKKNRDNSVGGQIPSVNKQEKVDKVAAHNVQLKSTPVQQSKPHQPEVVTKNPEIPSLEGDPRSRKGGDCKRKSQTSNNSSEVTAEKPSKPSEFATEVLSKKSKKAEEEASSDSEPEPIHSDWRLMSDSEADSIENNCIQDEVHQSSEDDAEDLDTSEDDLDEEPIELDENSENSEISEDSGGEEDCNDEVDDKAVTEATKKPEQEKKEVDKVAECRVNQKKFCLSNKAAILKEIKERTANFDSRCLYISPIPPDCNFDMIKKFIPKVKTCQFFTKHRTEKLRTYAFVEFADAETASNERLSIMGRLLAGKSVRAEFRTGQQVYAARTVDDIDFSCILVTGLLPAVTQLDLKAIFPTAESVRLSKVKDLSLGRATVTFVSDAVALDAFCQCHRFPLKGHPITVNFAFKAKSSAKSADVTHSKTSTATDENLESSNTTTESKPERVGKVLVQQMKDDSANTAEDTKLEKVVKTEMQKASFKLMELIKNSEKVPDDDDVCESGDNSDNDVADASEDEENSEGDGDDSEASIEISSGDDSEGENIDVELGKVLKARKDCAKALKSPGSKRNWKAPVDLKVVGKKRPAGSMPKILPVPSKRRR